MHKKHEKTQEYFNIEKGSFSIDIYTKFHLLLLTLMRQNLSNIQILCAMIYCWVIHTY